MKKGILRKCALALTCALLCVSLAGCGGTKNAQSLSFAETTSLEAIQAMNGKTVSIIGYMATLSPISGEYMYLMNMPYQSCPFCVPNTSQLANTLAVYAPKGKTFDYTDQAIRVTGKMKVEDYTDDYGYTYNYRLVDAVYETVDLSGVSEEYALWQAIASDGIVGEVNAMLDYVYFVCCWPEYTMSWTDDNGETDTVYLYPGDAENYLADEGVYGYADKAAEDYFSSLANRARAISDTGLNELIDVINEAHEVEKFARQELSDSHYTYDEAEDRYTLDRADDLYMRWQAVYLQFSEWLGKWQL